MAPLCLVEIVSIGYKNKSPIQLKTAETRAVLTEWDDIYDG